MATTAPDRKPRPAASGAAIRRPSKYPAATLHDSPPPVPVEPATRVLRRYRPAPFTGVLPQALAPLDAQTLVRLDQDLNTLLHHLQADERAAGIPLAQMWGLGPARRACRRTQGAVPQAHDGPQRGFVPGPLRL